MLSALLRDSAQEEPALPGLSVPSWMTCSALAWLDQKLPKDRREAAARSYAERAREVLRPAQARDDDPARTGLLIQFLANCPVAELRDPSLAAKLARQVVHKSPTAPRSWLLLGGALYRAGDFQDCVDALAKAAELSNGKMDACGFFLAMAHWRLDHKDQARECFENCERWLASKSFDPCVELVRAEAAALLGLPERGPPGPPGQAVDIKKH